MSAHLASATPKLTYTLEANIQAVSMRIPGQRDLLIVCSECLLNDDHACIGYGGGELWIRPFQVLAYCSPEHR